MKTEKLGNPNISFLSINIWIFNRPYKDSNDPYDSDWINIYFEFKNAFIKYKDDGALLTLSCIERFLKELKEMYKNLSGKAELSTYEPNIKIIIESKNGGKMECKYIFEKDYKSNFITEEEFDQTYLPKLIQELEESIEKIK
jgi:hypothetical protein